MSNILSKVYLFCRTSCRTPPFCLVICSNKLYCNIPPSSYLTRFICVTERPRRIHIFHLIDITRYGVPTGYTLDIVENPVCVRFLSALTHISAKCPVVVAHIGTTCDTVHTAFDNTTLFQQSQHTTTVHKRVGLCTCYALYSLRCNSK